MTNRPIFNSLSLYRSQRYRAVQPGKGAAEAKTQPQGHPQARIHRPKADHGPNPKPYRPQTGTPSRRAVRYTTVRLHPTRRAITGPVRPAEANRRIEASRSAWKAARVFLCTSRAAGVERMWCIVLRCRCRAPGVQWCYSGWFGW